MNNYTTTRRRENALKKRRVPASDFLLTLQSAVALSAYKIEDDASNTSQTLTTYYTNTCVKLTMITYLSFSERIAIANLSFTLVVLYPTIDDFDSSLLEPDSKPNLT